MKRFRNILIALPDDADHDLALRRAAGLAFRNNAKLTQLEVLPPLPPKIRNFRDGDSALQLDVIIAKDREDQLEQVVSSSQHRVPVDICITSGVPFVEITRAVIRNKHDLVVTAAPQNKDGDDKRLGSTVLHLLRKCPCEIWAIRSDSRNPYKQIMAAIDPSAYDGDETRLAHGVSVSLRGFRDQYELKDDLQFADYSTRELQDRVTPEHVLDILSEGNPRFRTGHRLTRDFQRQVDATAHQQTPLAAILSCSDSRVPAEC
jgi:hypothetical protein